MDKDIKELVRDRYRRIARTGESCCGAGCSCADTGLAIGYSPEDLAAAPDGANLGLGCGNPIALAGLRQGQTVLDLGSGAGFDCFLAAVRVGETGRVIGVDMTPEMIAKANANAAKAGIGNVEFRQGEIERLPVDDAEVDVVISNCVINLSPDKPAVFAEAFRALRPGGRLMVSDIVLLRPLPEPVRRSAAAYAGCVAGASPKQEYLDAIGAAGFREVCVVGEDSSNCWLTPEDGAQMGLTPEELALASTSLQSLRVAAVKPL